MPNDTAIFDGIPPALLLVLSGLKPAYSPSFLRVGSLAIIPPETEHNTELVRIQRLIGRVRKGLVTLPAIWSGWIPALDSPSVSLGLVSRAYLLCVPWNQTVEQVLKRWNQMDSLEGLDLRLNEDIGRLLSYPTWRPSRDLVSPKEGQREIQAFLTFNPLKESVVVVPEPISETESETEGLIREDPQTIESYGYLASERTLVEEELERRRDVYTGYLEGLGVGRVEMEVVDLRTSGSQG